MSRVYVGGLTPEIAERELEDEFSRYGAIQSIWVARKPPGFAFVEFEDSRDAEDAVRKGDGVRGWRVELSRRPPSGRRDTRDTRRDDYDRGPPRSGRGELRCYECNEVGHLARDCRNRGRGRSPPRRRDYSPRRRDHSPRRRDHSPRRRDDTPPRRRDDSPVRRRDDTPPRRRDETPPRHREDVDSPREPRDSPERRGDSPPAEDVRRDDSPYRGGSRSPANDANGDYRAASASPRRDQSPADRSRSRSRSR